MHKYMKVGLITKLGWNSNPKIRKTLLTPESRSNTLPVVIFGPLATKSLDFLRVWGLGDLFSIWLPTCYQWWVGKEQSEILYEKKEKKSYLFFCVPWTCFSLFGIRTRVPLTSDLVFSSFQISTSLWMTHHRHSLFFSSWLILRPLWNQSLNGDDGPFSVPLNSVKRQKTGWFYNMIKLFT